MLYRSFHCARWAASAALVLVTACVSNGTASRIDELDRCLRHADCPRGDLACENGVCRPVSSPECGRASDCVSPGLCQVVEGVRCVAGVCEYEPKVCNSPPANACIDSDTRFQSYASTGFCVSATGLCDYPSLQQDCPNCAANCLGQCAAVACDDDHGGCRSGGICVPGSPPACEYLGLADDGTACTLPGDPFSLLAGVCDGGECTGCLDDGDCGGGRHCSAGRCQVACVVGVACDDEDPCTYDDACGTGGVCRGTAVTDGNGCEDDPSLCGVRRSCNGTATCIETYPGAGVACDDGEACSHADACNGAGACVGIAVTDHGGCQNDAGLCGARRACNGTATCTETYPGGSTGCDDGQACTHTDVCDGAGACAGTPVTAHNGCDDDPGPCGALRACNGTATCTVTFPDTSVTCNDNVACTHTDRCNGAGGCAGQPVTAHGGCQSDAGPCGAQRSCNGSTTCTEVFPSTTVPCDDGSICTENDHCDAVGGCTGDACGGGEVCFPSHGCYPPPTISQPTSVECANLGVAHSGTSGNWLSAYTVTGPVGAHVVKYNRLASCGHVAWEPGSETPTNPGNAQAKFIGAGGTYLFELGNVAITNCEGGGYGQWESYAEVDGVSTANTIFATFYNSGCYSGPTSPASRYRKINTCTGARQFCSPCNDGMGCTAGEYCDVYSGGSASCQAPSFEVGPTCANFGVAHTGGDLLIWYRVYGPEGARVHKYNLHASCSGATWSEGSETSSSVERIDSTGYYELAARLAAPWDCATTDPAAGRWDQYATVGDDTEEFHEVQTSAATSYYYNSGCSSYNLCPSEAGSYCCSGSCTPW